MHHSDSFYHSPPSIPVPAHLTQPNSPLVQAEIEQKEKMARVEKIALTAIAEGAATTTIEQRLNIFNTVITQEKETASIFGVRFNHLGLKPTTAEERQQCLDLVTRIAQEGGCNSAKSLIINLIECDYLKEATIEQQLNLFKALMTQGDEVADLLAKAISSNKLNLEGATLDQRVNLYAEIVERGGESAARNLTEEVETLYLNEASVEQRLSLYAKILEAGESPASNLAYNIDKLNLNGASVEQRLNLYAKILEAGESPAIFLAAKIRKLNLDGATLEQRLDLCTMIAKGGQKGTRALINNLSQFDVGNAPVQKRLKLCEEIVKQEEFPTKELLKGTTSQERVKLCEEVIKQGKFPNKDLLKGTTPQERLTLYAMSAHFATQLTLFDNLNEDRLDLTETTPQERLELYKEIAKQGELKAEMLVLCLSNLDLNGATANERLELYKVIVRQGTSPATRLARRFSKSKLEFDDQGKDLSKQSLELCKEILNQGEEAASALAKSFNQVTLRAKDLFSFSQYVVFKGLQRDFAESEVFFNSMPDPITRRQILIDLLSPPSGLRGSIDVSQYESFTHDIAPIIAILDKEPNQLSENEIQDFKKFISIHPKLNILNSIIENIEKEQTEFVRAGLMSWAAYAAAVLNDLSIDQVAQFGQILNRILSYRNTSLRYTFMRSCSHVIQTPTGLEKYESTWDETKSTFLLATLTDFGLAPTELLQLRTQINQTRCLKDRKINSALAQLLLTINLYVPYEKEEAAHIAQCIIKALKQKPAGKIPHKPEVVAQEEQKKKEEERIEKAGQTKKQATYADQTKKDLATLTNVLQIFGKKEFLRLVTSKEEEPSAFFLANFEKLFVIEKMTDLMTRYENTFGQFRDPNALFTYLRTIDRLPDNEKKEVKATLNAYVNSVLKGNFQKTRYNPANSPHLRQIFSARPELEMLWCTPIRSKNAAGSEPTEVEVKEKEEQANTRYQTVDTDDPCNLLMIGTDVKGSCMRIDGDPNKIKALISYPMNGEIRAIAYIPENIPTARVALRLMWDSKNQCPVILQERLYSNVDDSATEERVYNLAKEKAKAMGLCLVSQDIRTEVPYNGTVTFLGGFAPFVYSDAGGGMQSGPFTVEDCYVLYDPNVPSQ